MPGFISLQIPQTGQPNSTEDPKIASDLTTLQTAINGNLDDTNLYSPNNAVRRLLLQASSTLFGGSNGVDYIMLESVFAASGASSAFPAPMWVADAGLSSQPADFQVANKTAYARVRGVVAANGTAPTSTFTLGLYQLTAVGGGAGVISYQFGAALTGSTVSVGSPGIGIAVVGESAQFALPTSTPQSPWVLGMKVSGSSMAGNSLVSVTAQLYAYNA